MSTYSLFTSESVSEGHPDKMADQISDAVLDAILKDDPHSRVAVRNYGKNRHDYYCRRSENRHLC